MSRELIADAALWLWQNRKSATSDVLQEAPPATIRFAFLQAREVQEWRESVERVSQVVRRDSIRVERYAGYLVAQCESSSTGERVSVLLDDRPEVEELRRELTEWLEQDAPDAREILLGEALVRLVAIEPNADNLRKWERPVGM